MPPKEETSAVKVTIKTEEEKTASLKGSLRTDQGHLTRKLNTIRAILQGTDDRGSGLDTARELKKLLSKEKEYREKTEFTYIQLNGLDQDKEQEFQDSMNRDAATMDELVAPTLRVLGSATESASVQKVPAITATPNTALKPFTLKRDDMPVTMRARIDQYEAYQDLKFGLPSLGNLTKAIQKVIQDDHGWTHM